MKPAACFLCGKTPAEEASATKGDWVAFADYDEATRDALSHSGGLEYACGDHLQAAQELRNKPLQDALAILRERYGVAENVQSKDMT